MSFVDETQVFEFLEPSIRYQSKVTNISLQVTFIEGDIIVNCQKVDEGWMTGTVQRTLQWGMLPANYVERVKQPTGLHYLS